MCLRAEAAPSGGGPLRDAAEEVPRQRASRVGPSGGWQVLVRGRRLASGRGGPAGGADAEIQRVAGGGLLVGPDPHQAEQAGRRPCGAGPGHRRPPAQRFPAAPGLHAHQRPLRAAPAPQGDRGPLRGLRPHIPGPRVDAASRLHGRPRRTGGEELPGKPGPRRRLPQAVRPARADARGPVHRRRGLPGRPPSRTPSGPRGFTAACSPNTRVTSTPPRPACGWDCAFTWRKSTARQ